VVEELTSSLGTKQDTAGGSESGIAFFIQVGYDISSEGGGGARYLIVGTLSGVGIQLCFIFTTLLEDRELGTSLLL